MGLKYEQQFIFNFHINSLYQLLANMHFLTEMKFTMNMNSYQPQNCCMRYNRGMSFTSWGEEITILLTPLGDSQTSMHIVSACVMPTQIIDFGKNRDNVTNISKYIMRHIGAFVQNQAPVVTQNQTFVHNSQVKFCPKCGASLADNRGNFCALCGAKLY